MLNRNERYISISFGCQANKSVELISLVSELSWMRSKTINLISRKLQNRERNPKFMRWKLLMLMTTQWHKTWSRREYYYAKNYSCSAKWEQSKKSFKWENEHQKTINKLFNTISRIGKWVFMGFCRFVFQDCGGCWKFFQGAGWRLPKSDSINSFWFSLNLRNFLVNALERLWKWYSYLLSSSLSEATSALAININFSPKTSLSLTLHPKT